jgi:hypothetical protein
VVAHIRSHVLRRGVVCPQVVLGLIAEDRPAAGVAEGDESAEAEAGAF